MSLIILGNLIDNQPSSLLEVPLTVWSAHYGVQAVVMISAVKSGLKGNDFQAPSLRCLTELLEINSQMIRTQMLNGIPFDHGLF